MYSCVLTDVLMAENCGCVDLLEFRIHTRSLAISGTFVALIV